MARARNLRVNSHSAALSHQKWTEKSYFHIAAAAAGVCAGAKLPYLCEVKAHVAAEISCDEILDF